MKTKKIPISFNPLDQGKLEELIDLMGITDVYGDVPKAVKFSINFTLSAIKNPEKVYTSLSSDEMQIYFKSVQKSFIREKIHEAAILDLQRHK